LDDHGKKLANYRKRKWLVGGSAIGIAGVILIVYMSTTNLASIPASVSSTNLSNNHKLLPGVAPGAAGQRSNNSQEIKHIVPLDQIVSGGPPPDGIPTIDNPKFLSVVDASKFLKDSDLVVGLTVNGQTKAYPLLILVWHEIINDKLGGVPVAVTYCPLCFTTQVFNRTISGHVVEFGTSGKLYNNNLVMYDRLSGSLWSQALGEGIVGTHAGESLKRIAFDLAYWKDWKQLYPNSMVLSTDTGFTRPYGVDPYGDYYTSDQLFFPISNVDKRLGLKETVVGLGNEGQYKAYVLHQIDTSKVINDKVGNKSIVLFSLYPRMVRAYVPIIDGQTLDFQYNTTANKITDTQTGSEWNFDGLTVNGQMKGKQLNRLPFDEGFWFEWAAFHPQTRIYPG
jgi:Protein of unknown function (DUF3179)